jgi:hypothetical protein
MATRATVDEVLAVMDFAPGVDDITPFVEAADELVTEMCAVVPYSATRLKLIEIWLAAHILAVRNARVQSEQLGEQMVTYATFQQGLGQTSYGQQALMLDTHGGLAYIANHVAVGKRAKAGVAWLGTPQTPLQTPQSWRFQGLL